VARWNIAWIALVVLVGCRSARVAEETDHDHGEERPPPLCTDLRCGWRAPVDDAHESRRGAPYVHAFHLEPAFLGRDVLVHAEREGDEHGLELELEYALTRRLLLLAELPYHWAEDDEGLGDLGLGLRGLLVETDRLLVSTQVGLGFPTARRDLGEDEVVVSPRALAWGDLGCWFTAQAGVGLDYGAESGDLELSWGGALAKSFSCDALLPWCTCRRPHSHGEEEHGHDSVLTLFLEGRGSLALSGPEDGATSHELLFGVSVPLYRGVDARAGWTLRWDEDDDAAAGWVAGFVLHL
jgi:hypothetical protein